MTILLSSILGGTFEGAQGAQGVQGAVGVQGAQGSAGAQGAVGAQGSAGAQGAVGAQGSVGAQGAQGSVGAQGAQGSVGESYWIQTSVGIHTLSNVGIGTTNPTSKLTVVGDVRVTGVVTTTSIVVSSGSTFTNGPILVGAATSTGTSLQRLQVTGGAYVSGNLGVGTTTPTSKLAVVGDTNVSGVVTAFDFYNTAEYPNVRPTLDLAFAQTKILDSRITFTRASTATYVGFDGLIKTAAVNEPRFDHNPTTGESLGLLVEEQRTNSIRNNTMVGAVAGTPGTNPTSWLYATAQSNGLTISVIGTGVENGINYIDYRFNGTTVASPNSCAVGFDNGVAATGQTWTQALYWKLVGGSATGVVNWQIGLIESTSGGAFVTGAFYTQTAPTSAALINQRPTATRTLSGGATVGLCSATLNISVTGNTAIDFTLRIGLPQLEQGAFATSPILTSTAAVTRNADEASITGSAFSGWYRQDEGTVFAEGSVLNTGSNRFMVALSDGTINEEIALFWASVFASLVTDGGAAQANSFGGTVTANTRSFHSFGYKVNDFQGYGNGTALATDTSGTLPTADRMTIGSRVNNTFRANGTIRRLTYWPVRLPNAQLQTITL